MMDVTKFPRLEIEQVSPSVEDGTVAVKRLVNDSITVGAAIFKDGHDLISARVLIRERGSTTTREVCRLSYDFDPDHWQGRFFLDQPGDWEMIVEAWPDLFGTWRRDLDKRIQAGQDVSGELVEGAFLVKQRQKLAPEEDQEPLANAARVLGDESASMDTRKRVAFSQTLLDLMFGPLERDAPSWSKPYPLRIDRREAGVAAWYELFPRSQGTDPARHGTFADVEKRVPDISAMGFDVIYLPPIHPIGLTHRKGRNNTTVAEPGDVGSPWAIGAAEGGHDAIHPELGTVEDFRKLVATCSEFGIEIALDIAFQCSPDHPWVKEHPDWFFIRQDGTIRYAENPPKKYEDIYPLNYWGKNAGGLWEACRDVILYWVEQGVKTFRIDNPHTKPLSFWRWCIQEVQAKHPDTVFLSESFTRPNRMMGLAKLGFTQSYTYFTWKNTKAELTEFLEWITQPPVSEFYRPNFFTNTPDILHEYLQHSGPAGFRIRLLLAATLAPVYGIYSGFELCEGDAVRPGSEEYLDSEKYQIKVRDWNAPGNIRRDVAKLNRIRRAEPALQHLTNLRFCSTDTEDIISYLKLDPAGSSDSVQERESARHLLGVVNLNPHEPRETTVHVPLQELGIGIDEEYWVHDLLTGTTYTWRGADNYVLLQPSDKVGHLFRVERRP